MNVFRRSAALVKSAPLSQAVRTYASAPASSQIPLALHGIEGRYATALYSAAQKKGALESVESELVKLRATLDKDPKTKTLLESPLVDKKAKKSIVQSLVQGRVSEITRNFFDLLAENGRLDQTSKILGAFEQLMAAYRREVPVTVISAKELDAKTSRQLQGILQKSNLLDKDAKLILTNKIDPNILGGLVIDFGDKTIDLSVSSKINKLNRLLTEAI
ncbi:hypothetical protein SpCBS45565_g00698 [Spizellomyces sp. 'palustris']|nr:hypothetical protein SpCBS45565_g00698 [Spizellomyces sp. 'palustris']